MANFTMYLANLFAENSEDVNFQNLFQNPDFKNFIHNRLGTSIKARGSVRDKATFRLLNKEMNNSMEKSLTEVRLNYDHLKKLSQTNFKDTVKKLKVTFNASNCQNFIDDAHYGIFVYADELTLLSPKIFSNMKVVKVIVDKSIDKKFGKYVWLSVRFNMPLCLRGLIIVNYSEECNTIDFEGQFDIIPIEISNSVFQGIGPQCSNCKAHIHNISIIDAPDQGISAEHCIQSIFEGISVEGVADEGVNVYQCDRIQLKNISVKNCQCPRAGANFEFSDNVDIQKIQIHQNKINFLKTNGCIQDSIIEASTVGITLSESQISHRNVSISCDVHGDDVIMDEQSSWTRLE